MLGRIMAGLQAVIAHDEAGQALFVAYHPPDIPLFPVQAAFVLIPTRLTRPASSAAL